MGKDNYYVDSEFFTPHSNFQSCFKQQIYFSWAIQRYLKHDSYLDPSENDLMCFSSYFFLYFSSIGKKKTNSEHSSESVTDKVKSMLPCVLLSFLVL